MKNLFKFLGLGLIALFLVVGVGAGTASATLTLSDLAVTSGGVLTLATTGAVSLSGTTATSGALAIIGAATSATEANISANTGAVDGLDINLKNTGATVTRVRGINAYVTDAGGTASRLTAIQGAAFKTSGTSTEDIWGTNSVVSFTGGSVPNVYGVVGDLTIGASGTVSSTQKNSYATAGLFTSYIAGTVTNSIDSAVIAQISGDTGRVKSAEGTYGVVSMLNGSAGAESAAGASAAFKVMNFNTNSGKFDYGLDMYYSSGSFSNLFNTADIRLSSGAEIMSGTSTNPDTDSVTCTTLGSLYLSTGAGGTTWHCTVAGVGAAATWVAI